MRSDWFQFLDSTEKKPSFTAATTSTLNAVSYSTGSLSAVDSQATDALINASRAWLKHHHPVARPKQGQVI